MEEELKYYDDMLEFLINLADNFQIVDPMDRPGFFNREDDELTDAMKVSELKKVIHQLEGMKDTSLNTPLTAKAYRMMEKLYQLEMKECTKVMEDYLQQAKEIGSDFKYKLRDNEVIKSYK